MRNMKKSNNLSRNLSILFLCGIFVWKQETTNTNMIFSETKAEDVTSSPVRLMPYHSLLSAMFQPPVPKRGRQERSHSFFNQLPSRRHRIPSYKYRGGLKQFYSSRKRPERRRRPLSYNKFTKHSRRPLISFSKPQNSFVPGGMKN